MSFDLDDTLYDNWPYIAEAEKRLFAYLTKHYPATQSLSKADWQTYKREALNKDPALWSDMGELRKITLRRGLSQVGYQSHALEHAVDNSFEYFYFERSNFKVAEDFCSVLAQLSEKLPLVAITNGNVQLEQIGIADYFTKTYKANRNQMMKPDPYMFDLASHDLKIAPSHFLHVGDNLEKDVWGATNAGFKSAWYAVNRPMRLEREDVKVLPNIQLQHLRDLLVILN